VIPSSRAESQALRSLDAGVGQELIVMVQDNAEPCFKILVMKVHNVIEETRTLPIIHDPFYPVWISCARLLIEYGMIVRVESRSGLMEHLHGLKKGSVSI
jgi:hypothetical protein